MINYLKVCVILRGVSGSSKSTFANYLEFLGRENFDVTICSADDYFYEKYGEYKWNAAELGAAHNFCQTNFNNALSLNHNLVVVANTNTKESDFKYYLDKAQESGYTVFSLVVEKRFEGGDNGHNVPAETLSKMENNIKSSLKLR
jgi:uridine kinase